MKRKYPYCRGTVRRWCKVCRAYRFVRLAMRRDAHCCLTCGAKTTAFEEYASGLLWAGMTVVRNPDMDRNDIRLTYGV